MKKLIKTLLAMSLLSTSLISNVYVAHAQDEIFCTQLSGSNIDVQNYPNNDSIYCSDLDQIFVEKTNNGGMQVNSDENNLEVDKAALNSVITEANKVKEEDYTAESWSDFQSALATAKNVVADEDATQEEVDGAISSLNAAVKALVTKHGESEQPEEVSYEELWELMYLVERLNETAFTEETWANLMEAMNYARTVKASEDRTKEEIYLAYVNLKEAVDNLKLLPTIEVKELPEIASRPYLEEVEPGMYYVSWDACERADRYVVKVFNYTTQEARYINVTNDTSVYIDGLTALNTVWGFRIMAGNEIGYANYGQMIVDFATPKAPENVKILQDNYKNVTLTWDEIETCKSYEIYRKSYKEDSEYTLVGTTKETSFTSKNLKTGKTYSYYVVAKGGASYRVSEPSEVVSIATQLEGKPKLSLEKLSKTKFKLNWTKVDGATRYIIYCKRNSDSYKKVLTLSSKNLEYTTTELPKGNYTYVVKAARYDSSDRVMTAGSNAVSGTSTYSKPVITLKAGAKQIKVSWDKVEGVTNYEVYRSTSKSGTYKKVKTTKETCFTSKSLTSGKTYYFKIRGYKVYKKNEKSQEKIYTSYSDVKSAKAK